MPCLMRWPAKLPRGRVTAQMGITMDLHATFLAAAGIAPPTTKPLDGIDLIPLLATAPGPATTASTLNPSTATASTATGSVIAAPRERTFFWRMDRSNRKQRAIREGRWKYLNDGNTMDLLFDLEADIGERVNLGYRHPEVLARLKKSLAAWEAEMDATEREILVR